ncbi:MAG: NAD-dependent DNA ligase LigA [Lentisphaeria bacterium]|nr:NAD-dependent DNA ligase LigA [Lentisphaeria bacterium]
MDIASLQQQAEDLRRQIRHHDRLYYIDATPEISDQDYDKLYHALQDLEAAHPELLTPDSPTQRMHGGIADGFQTVDHTVPMLSLENTYNAADLERFHESVLKGLRGETPTYVVEPKIDGVSIAVRYRDGVLVQAVTRGNGKQGDDVTANIRTIPSIPLRLNTENPPAFFEARGECYLPRAGFARLNEHRLAEGLEPFANARNATAGSIKLLDSHEVATRPLDVLFYTQGLIDGVEISSQQELFQTFAKFGLKTQKWLRVVHDFDGIKDAIAELDGLRQGMPYDTDGAVIKVDSFRQRAVLGMTAKAPCWAKAYKYEPERAATKLKAITIQVGRTGVLAPVAELEPVFLSGSTISRATLHNEDEIARKDIRIGDTVLIEKAGEVIPAVVKVLQERRPADAIPYDLPGSLHGKCPSCGGPIHRDPQFAAWRCENLQCPAQNVRRVEYFAARNALDIESIGGVVAEALCDSGLIREPLDLFDLTLDDMASLNLGTAEEPRVFGPKNAAKVLSALEAARTKPLGNWLEAMGIPDVGAATAFQLGRIHKDLAEVANSPYLKALLDLLDYQNGSAPHRVDAALPPEDLFDLRKPVGLDDLVPQLKRAGLIKKSSAKGAYVTTTIGPKTAQSVLTFFAGPIGRKWLERLATLDIVPRGENAGADQNADGPLAGKTFVLTGTLTSMGRDEASAKIRALGGTAAGAVSKNTTYLVAGANTGVRKTEKAAELGVQVIDEETFLKLLQQGRL